MRRAVLTLVLVLPLLAACQLALPGRDRASAEPANPITGDAITTTSLDAAPAAATAAPAEVAGADAQAAAAGSPAAATEVEAEVEAEVEVEAAAKAPVAPAPPVVQKSPAHIACEEDGGTWARAGAGGGMSCVRQTRDGGKQCDSKTDCQGECLARSRTCAPIQPLFGCNAVLMDNGAEVSLCID